MLEVCAIMSGALACIEIRNAGTAPVIHQCRIINRNGSNLNIHKLNNNQHSAWNIINNSNVTRRGNTE